MKALTRKNYGSPEILRLKEIEKPTIKPNEILVRVHATTVNRTDCGILTANYFAIRFFTGLVKPKHLVPGTDFAGVVEAVGSAVFSFAVGDKVMGLNDNGLQSQAEYMAIAADAPIEKVPEGINFAMAAASLEGAHYARNFINKATLKAGQRVLLIGATGAIGSAAVQMLVAQHIDVTAVGHSALKRKIESWGVQKVFCYDQEDFLSLAEGKFDFVFDAVGKSSFGKCKSLLTKNGIYISSELGPGAENLYLPLLTKIKGGQRVIFPMPADLKKSVQNSAKLLSERKFNPLIDKIFPPEKGVEAYQYADSGQKMGNVILDFSA